MLIEHYDLEIFTPPCAPGAERLAAIARLTTDISAVFPYLNATLRGQPIVPQPGRSPGRKVVMMWFFMPIEVGCIPSASGRLPA
jgi:hypothetical protein